VVNCMHCDQKSKFWLISRYRKVRRREKAHPTKSANDCKKEI
jgi:hypothetical protein